MKYVYFTVINKHIIIIMTINKILVGYNNIVHIMLTTMFFCKK